jgi:hypothetical protein
MLQVAEKNSSDLICYDSRLSFALQNPSDQICYDSRKAFASGESFVASVVLHTCRTEIFIVSDNEKLFEAVFEVVGEGFQLSQGLFAELVRRNILQSTSFFSVKTLMEKLEWAKAHVLKEFELITEEQASLV